METWQTILLAFGGNAILLAILGYLGKSILERILERDSIKFQQELKAKSDAAIESFKSELQLRFVEHQVRFSTLHERRAQLIAELYAKLVELRRSGSDFVKYYYGRNAEEKKQALERLWRAVDAFDNHFAGSRIYFDSSICESLDSFRDALSKGVSLLSVFVHERSLVESEEQVFGEWEAAMAVLDKDVPLINDALELSFRKLLGVETIPR